MVKPEIDKNISEIEQLLSREDSIACPRKVADDMHELIEKGLRKQDRKRGIRPVAQMSAILSRSFEWPYLNGCLAILKGDLSGWSLVEQAWQRQAWAITIWVIECQEGLRDYGASDALLHAHSGLVLGHYDWAKEIVPRAIKIPDPHGYLGPFHAYTMNLLSHWLDSNWIVPDSYPAMGRWKSVFDAWNDPSRLVDAIKWMCDDRVVESFDPDYEHPIRVYLMSRIPFEVLSLYACRRDLNLPTPSVDHSELNLPLAQIPGSVARLDDPWVDRALEWLREKLPPIREFSI